MGQYFENQNLNSNIVKHNVKIGEFSFVFSTDNGVFSKGKLDFGTRLLIETISSCIESGKLLDVGCGYGVIGIYFAKMGLDVSMVDINKRALHLSEMNAKENNVTCNIYESNVYGNVSGKYNYIVTNPPIRAGKKIVYSILEDAANYLEEDGSLFFVMRKNHGLKSTLLDLEKIYNITVINKKNGFFIIEAKKR